MARQTQAATGDLRPLNPATLEELGTVPASPPEEVAEIRQLVKKEMEGVYSLEVPLIVDVGTGPNWRDAK